ncbi:hypothetical protein Peur_028516 [Populus x canadensis]
MADKHGLTGRDQTALVLIRDVCPFSTFLPVIVAEKSGKLERKAPDKVFCGVLITACETHGEGDTNGKALSSSGYQFLTGGGALFKVKTLSSQPFTERKCVWHHHHR